MLLEAGETISFAARSAPIQKSMNFGRRRLTIRTLAISFYPSANRALIARMIAVPATLPASQSASCRA
jgi:hypothetical protein